MAWAALAVFGAAYAFIAGVRIRGVGLDRAGGALAGAVLMVGLGIVPASDITGAGARPAVDWDTLLLLLGMLVISAALLESGALDSLAASALGFSAHPRALLATVGASSAVLSAFLVNDTVCLVLTPVVLAAVRRAGLPPLPYLLAVCMGANAGSVATFTGNPQNMIIQGASGMPYAQWARVMALPAALSVGAVLGVLDVAFRRQLAHARAPGQAAPAGAAPGVVPVFRHPAAWVMGAVIAGFFAGLPLGWTAVGGAAVVLALRPAPARELLQRVDFVLLLFFASLFVLVHGVQRAGWVDRALAWAGPLLSGGGLREAWAFAGVSFVGSNLFSNVPFVLLARTWVAELADPTLGWYVLGLSSTLAGNLTLVGSVANLIVFELAREDVDVGFWDYARIGIPVTLASLVLSLAALFAGRAL